MLVGREEDHMKKFRLIAFVLLMSLFICLASCATEKSGYLDSLKAPGEYLATVEYEGVTYEAQINLEVSTDTAERAATLTVMSPDELVGMTLTVENGICHICLDGLEGVTVEPGALSDNSPLVCALKLMNPSTVIGATLGGEYNEIVTSEAVYRTDRYGNVREIYSDGLYIKLIPAEKNE